MGCGAGSLKLRHTYQPVRLSKLTSGVRVPGGRPPPPPLPLQIVANALLLLLLGLHCFWFLMFVRMGLSKLFEGAAAHDIGEKEYEGESSDDDGE